MYKQKDGWFTEVNGHAVRKRNYGLRHASGWPRGNPKGILFHYTAGCGSDIGPVLSSRNISVHFNVDREGVIWQYVSTKDAAYHAYDASYVYFGVEHTALKGVCNLTDKQLKASAKLFAALVEWTKRAYGVSIPLVHQPGPALVPGFKDHKDGTSDTWNPNVHVDGLYKWSWDKYIEEIKSNLAEGDEMAFEDFKKGVKSFWNEEDEPADNADPDFSFGYRFAKKASREPAPGDHQHTVTGVAS